MKFEIGIKDGKIASIGDEISSNQTDEVVDANGNRIFLVAVDLHYHVEN